MTQVLLETVPGTAFVTSQSVAILGFDAALARRCQTTVSATVLNNVNDRFEKRFSNSIFVQCVDRGVGFFEAWVSVFDGGLNWGCRLSILALTGETECCTV